MIDYQFLAGLNAETAKLYGFCDGPFSPRHLPVVTPVNVAMCVKCDGGNVIADDLCLDCLQS